MFNVNKKYVLKNFTEPQIYRKLQSSSLDIIYRLRKLFLINFSHSTNFSALLNGDTLTVSCTRQLTSYHLNINSTEGEVEVLSDSRELTFSLLQFFYFAHSETVGTSKKLLNELCEVESDFGTRPPLTRICVCAVCVVSTARGSSSSRGPTLPRVRPLPVRRRSVRSGDPSAQTHRCTCALPARECRKL